MSNKSMIFAIVGVVLVGLALFYFMAYNGSAPMSQAPAAGQGKIVIGISDAAMAIEGVSSIMMTVDKVEMLGASSSWVTISSVSKQYDLLQLKASGAIALLADVNLSAGTYNQIRLTIGKVEISASGSIREAKLPSGTLKIVGRIVVEEGKTATAVLDFKADKSLHITGNGMFVLAPVVHLQTKSDVSVEVRTDATLKIVGGKDEDEVDVGMDERGETKEDFELDEDADIDIDAEGTIHIEDKGDREDGEDEEDRSGTELKLSLSAQNNSGIAGKVTLESVDGKIKVTLDLAGVPTGVVGLLGVSLGATHPAHIHLGSCANPGGVKYPLMPTVDGRSTTVVDVSMAALRAQLPLAINVHKSSEQMGSYVACVDIKM
jgi:hypothetical protein